MKKNIFLLSLAFLFFVPEILADKRAERGKCYISIGYVNDRAGVAEFAKNSFIKPENFELFEREDKKVYLTLGKIDENLFKKLQSQNKTYDFNCSRGKGYEERLGLNSDFQIIGGNKINIVSAEQFISVVSSIEIEKQRLVDLEVEKQVQARLAAEKEKQRLAELERQRKAEADRLAAIEKAKQDEIDRLAAPPAPSDSTSERSVTQSIDSGALLGEWFNKHEYLVLIFETLTNRSGGSGSLDKRELSANCEVAIQQDLKEEEPDDFLARIGNKAHVYLASGNEKSFVKLTQHPNCVAAFQGLPSARQLCNEIDKTMPARVTVDESGMPVSYTSNWVQWNIDAADFSADNRVVSLSASKDGQNLEAFAYVCGLN